MDFVPKVYMTVFLVVSSIFYEVRLSSSTSICDVEKCRCNDNGKDVNCYKADLSTAPDSAISVPDSALYLRIERSSGLQQLLDNGLLQNMSRLQELSLLKNKVQIKTHHFIGLTSLKTLNLTMKDRAPFPADALRSLTSIERIQNPINEKLFVHFRPEENVMKEEGCQADKCYDVCGEPDYLNEPKELVSHVNLDKDNPTRFKDWYIHAMHFDLYKLRHQYGKQYVWTQVATASKPVKTLYAPPYVQEIYVVTREFKFDHAYTGRNDKSRCYVKLLKIRNSDNWFVIKFQPGITVIAQDVSMGDYCKLDDEPFTVTDKFITDKFIRALNSMRLEYLRALTYCAKAKGQESSRVASLKILDWATTVMDWLPQEKVINYYTEAMNARSDLETNVEGARFVPTLTRDAYGRILDLQYRLAKSYKTEYDQLLQKQNDRKFQFTLMNVMKQEASSLAGSTEVDYKNARDALETSRIAIEKLKRHFEETKPKLEAARKTFEAGIVAYGIHESARALFGVFKAIKGVFKGDPVQAVDGLWGTFERLVKMIRTLDRVIKANDEMMKFVAGQKMDIESQKRYLEDLGKAAQLSVNIVEWRNMVTAVEILLQEGDAAGIIGSRGYRRRLQELAEWGEALSKETIRQTDLLRRFLSLEAALKAREFYTDQVEEAIYDMERASLNQKRLKEALSLQISDMKWVISNTLHSYCQSYFYYQFKSCSLEIMPRLSDSLLDLVRKVDKAKIDSIESLALLQPTQPIDINIYARDKGNCSLDSSDDEESPGRVECPVSDLKEGNSLVYTIDRNRGALKWMQRVRVTEFVLEFVGLKMADPEEYLHVSIRNVGTFQDSYKNQVYNFTGMPLKKAFVYSPATNEILMRAVVHQSQGEYLQEISPFTTWVFDIDPKVNSKFDLSGVTEVKIGIKGSAVSKYSYFKKKRPDERIVADAAAFGYLHSQTISSASKYVLMTGFFLAWFLGASYFLEGSWDFLFSTYGFIFTVPDLTPNIGVFWYFFTEMFEHFRVFFLWVFQLHLFIYALPLGIRLRSHSIFLMYILLALIAVFKSYPSYGDVTLYLSMLPMWAHTFKYSRNLFLITCMFVSCTVMAPILYHLWIYAGSANANFYFAITLTFSTGQVFLITDLLFAYLRRDWHMMNGPKPKLPDGSPASIQLK